VRQVAGAALKEILLPLLKVTLGYWGLVATRKLVAVFILHAKNALVEATSKLFTSVPVLVHGGPTCKEREVLWVIPLVTHGVWLVKRALA